MDSKKSKENPEVVIHIQKDNPSMTETSTLTKKGNGDGGNTMDNDKYVTHEELNHAVDNLSNKIELSSEKILHQMDNHFHDLKENISNVKSTANENKEKINWILYTAVGGIIISVVTTIITNIIIHK